MSRLKARGWVYRNRYDYCPTCVEQGIHKLGESIFNKPPIVSDDPDPFGEFITGFEYKEK